MGDVVRPSQFRSKTPIRITDAEVARRILLLFRDISGSVVGGLSWRRMARILGVLYVFILKRMAPQTSRESFEDVANKFQKQFEVVDRLWLASSSEKRLMNSAGVNGKP